MQLCKLIETSIKNPEKSTDLSEKYLEEYHYFKDGKNLNCKIHYSIEREPLGTGGAIKQASRYLSDTFLVLNGDNLLLIDYQDLINAFYKGTDKVGMLVCWKNEGTTFQSNVKLNENDQRILSYNYLDSSGMGYVDSGVKTFSKTLLSHFGSEAAFSLEKAVLPQLADKGLLMGYLTENHALDIGTPKNLEKTRTHLEKVFGSHAKS